MGFRDASKTEVQGGRLAGREGGMVMNVVDVVVVRVIIVELSRLVLS